MEDQTQREDAPLEESSSQELQGVPEETQEKSAQEVAAETAQEVAAETAQEVAAETGQEVAAETGQEVAPETETEEPVQDSTDPGGKQESVQEQDVPEDSGVEAEAEASGGDVADDEQAKGGWDNQETKDTAEPAPRSIVALGEPGVDYLGTGRRKTATARVRLRRGSGDFIINGKKMEEYFPVAEHQTQAVLPFQVTDTMGFFNARVRVRGGGASGQAGAVRLGVARALCEVDLELRPLLKKEGLLTRDPRMVERKKYGRKGARKSFQFSKR